MTTAPVPVDPALDDALSRWEHHGRPGLPDRGFTLGRLPGRSRRGIYRAGSGEVVLEPDGHILRMAVAPNRRHIAIQLADRADESAVLAIVDADAPATSPIGRIRSYSDIRCRYDPMAWDARSHVVELITGEPRRIVTLDIHSGQIMATEPPGDADATRLRLFPAGPHGLVAETRPVADRTGAVTRLVDRVTGSRIAAFRAVVRVLDLGADVLVDDGAALHVVDPRSGVNRWSWQDPDVTITSLTVADGHVHAAAVREGRSVLLRIADGHVLDERPVADGGTPAVAAEVGTDGGRVHVLVEAPAMPPRVAPAHDLGTDHTGVDESGVDNGGAAVTRWHTVTADDGAGIDVAITSPHDIAGPAPLILTCYGGFGVPNLPVFEPTVPAWAEHGGHYAIAQVRGGGERGRAWRDAGRGRNKRRGIDDLACVARGLVDAGYTRPDQLVLAGASHGGVLAASCAFGAPELCAGVVSTAAPLDLLNLDAHPLGRRWVTEFGEPDDPRGLDELRRISPLHRARALPEGVGPPRFLGIVLADDARVSAEATHAVAGALRAKGGVAAVWRAERTGHGSNHLDSLHRLGATVLGFAADVTAPARPRPAPRPAV